uniref:NADH-ubiquinone oxidoreductase chain 6 n=1 Tax=Eoscarta assimilis TaxID=2815129 RepID=A0A8F6D4Y1_9HEMI|nr:NADH dehydrogenase subunit 6 [Eoscarta assimilis]
MKLMLIMMIMSSMTFLMMKHPLSAGFMLLVQTTLTCLMNGLNNYSYWFSYILFIVFIGGMMVLFIYMASIASNEKFKFSIKTSLLIITTMLLIMTIMNMNNNIYILMNETFNYLLYSKNMNKEMISIMKMFNYPTMMLSIIAITYLLFTLITTVKITNIEEGPLRTKN